MVPEQVKVDYILLSKADLAKKQTVSDAEIQAYYQQNQYKQPLASVKDKIIAAIQQQKADQAYAQIGSQLSTLAYENPNSLNFVAQQLGLTVQQTGLFSQAGAKTGIAANQQVVSVAFSDNVLKQGNNSDIINLSDDQAVIIRLNQDVPAAPQPLSQVKAQINTLLVQQAARELALQQAVAIETALQQGKDVASIAKQYGLSWQQKANLSHDDKTANTDLLSAVFSVPRPVAGHPAVDVANLKNGDILVFSVVKVHNPSSPSPELLGVFTKLLQPMMAQFMYEQYLSALKAHADIEVLEK
jgi:peptidyl-prolyl cis-trans isomerase D